MAAFQFKKGSFKDLVHGLLGVAIPTFGEDVYYRPKKGGTFKIRAVFDENFQQVNPDTEEVIATNIPQIGVRLIDLPFKPEQGDRVDILDRCFRVTDSQEDGQGGATLVLHRM